MSRVIVDPDLRRWEAYATAGDYGFPTPGRIVFRCTSDRGLRPRTVTVPGDKSDAERTVVEASDAELREMLARAEEID